MAVLKTKPTDLKVEDYLSTLDERKKDDANRLIAMMNALTHMKPVMWGDAIIGFGHVNLTYASGRNIDYFLIGFAMRKNAITIYLSVDVNRKVFDRLGKHTKGVGCLYIQKLSDVDLDELRAILDESVKTLTKK